jgi:hypothetical protein
LRGPPFRVVSVEPPIRIKKEATYRIGSVRAGLDGAKTMKRRKETPKQAVNCNGLLGYYNIASAS